MTINDLWNSITSHSNISLPVYNTVGCRQAERYLLSLFLETITLCTFMIQHQSARKWVKVLKFVTCSQIIKIDLLFRAVDKGGSRGVPAPHLPAPTTTSTTSWSKNFFSHKIRKEDFIFLNKIIVRYWILILSR